MYKTHSTSPEKHVEVPFNFSIQVEVLVSKSKLMPKCYFKYESTQIRKQCILNNVEFDGGENMKTDFITLYRDRGLIHSVLLICNMWDMA